MRTSKKLLSVFLAVVMIVTTCSVGFTAFAKEKNSIWSTQCEAEDAFDTLNGLVDEFVPGLLMGIGAIGDPYLAKKAAEKGKTVDELTDKEKEAIKENSTLPEILQVLQPLLLNLLDGTSQSDFVGKYFPGNSEAKFDFLITEDTLSYFTLVAICDKYGHDFSGNPLNASQKAELLDWFDTLMAMANKAIASESLLLKYAETFSSDLGETYPNATLYSLAHFDFNVTDEDASAISGMIDKLNAKLVACGVTEDQLTITNIGELIFYTLGMGQNILTAAKYYKLLHDVGVTVDFHGTGDLLSMDMEVPYDISEDINISNYAKVITYATLVQFGLVEDGQPIDWVVASEALMGMPAEECTPEICELVESSIESYTLDFYIDTVLASHYNETLAAIAVKEGKVSSVAEFNEKVAAVAYTGDLTELSEAQYKQFALGVHRTFEGGSEGKNADTFFSGTKASYSATGITFELQLPAALKGTSAAEYFRLITGYPKNNDYKFNFVSAVLPNFISGAYITDAGNNYILGDDDLPQLNPISPDFATIAEYLEAANNFAPSWVFTTLTGIEGSIVDKTSKQSFIIDVVDYVNNMPIGDASGSDAITLTDEEKTLITQCGMVFAGDIGTEALNYKLNDTVVTLLKSKLLGDDTIEDMVNNLLNTPVNLVDAIDNVWKRLVNSPVETIVELVPLLVVLLDELLVPIVLNEPGDTWNGTVWNLLNNSLLADMTLASGSHVGFDQLGWDLNKLLPDLMHWLFEQEAATGLTFYEDKDVVQTYEDDDHNIQNKIYRMAQVNTADMKNYTVKDADGNQITRVDDGDTATFSYKGLTTTDFDEIKAANPDAEFTYTMHYDGSVPRLTGIYIADKALAGANITGLSKIFRNLIGNDDIGNGLGELVTEIARLFMVAVDEFVGNPEYRDPKTHDSSGQLTGSGLNNLFVALPQLFDIMENLGADKYGVAADAWTYCYDGKIAPKGDYGDLRNKDVEDLKSFAMDPDAKATFGVFARIFVEQWINAILSLLNNVVGDGNTSTAFTENLPIVTGLLQSLGGFGEDSIFTDILNGVFQLKRGDKYSFEFKAAESTGLVGLNADNAFFLITNINTLVDLIKSLINSGKEDASAASFDASALAEYYSSIQGDKLLAAQYTAPTYTAAELKDVNGVITSLDEMLAALLSDSSINGYGFDTAGNIASGVVSLLSNYITADDATSILGLLNDYLYYLDGAGERSADKDGNMDPKKVYTNKNLTDLIVRTFALIESVLESIPALASFDYIKGDIKYNIIVEAVEGVISPDAIGIRLDDYSSAQSKILKLDCWNDAIKDGKVDISLDWNVSDGDNEAFFKGLSSALRLVTTILGVVIVDTGWYDTIVAPVLGALCEPNGVTVNTPEKGATYRDDIIICLLESVTGFLNKLLAAPATTLINSIKGIAGILDDNSGATIASIVSGAIAPLSAELGGVVNILSMKSSKLGSVSLTLAQLVSGLAEKLDFYATVEDNVLVNITHRNIPICGSNLIDIANKYLGELAGITLQNIDWSVVSKAETPAHVLAYILSYVVDMVVDNDNLSAIIALIVGDGEVNDTLNAVITAIQEGKLDGKAIVMVLSKALKLASSPGVFAWTFEHYLQEKIENFSYPVGLTKTQADQAVQNIDTVINNIFPLLASLGIDLGGNDLNAILNKNLFTNELLTTLAKALYGALNSNKTVVQVLGILGIPCTTADVAAILTDTSYGATFSSAAKTIKSAGSWDKVSKVNWGFTNGSKNAQQGFVNALVAILRPVNDVLAVFLNSGSLGIDADALIGLLKGLVSTEPTYLNIGSTAAQLTMSMDGTSFIIDILPTDKETHKPLAGGKNSQIVLDLNAISKLAIYGANGYNSAIIPLLEAFQCSGIVSDAQYKKDIAKAKDALLLDILNPILGGKSTSLLNKIAEKPLETITTLLPNIAVFIDGHGVSQLVANLLGPITSIIEEVAGAIDIDALVAAILGAPEGTPLGDVVGDLLGLPSGTLKLDLSDLASINLEDAIIPLVNTILSGANIDITLTDIDWNLLASLGTRTTYTSLATDVDGNALTGKKLTNVDYGKTLITVLRYVLNTVINNVKSLQKLILGIDAIKNNDIIKSVVNNVFGQIKTHTADQIIVAIYYFFVGEPTAALWDYTSYKTEKSKFKMPEGVTEADVERLISFIDGIVEEIDLNVLLKQYLYTDDMINLLAGLIYGKLGDMKINDSIKVNDILSIIGVDLSTKAVASILTDKSYGETSQFKSAAKKIGAAKSWSKVDFDKLSWGVKDQKTFLNALVAILRPLYGVLDVIVADGSLDVLEGIHIPGSNGYVSTIVPLLEAFKCEGIKSYDKYLSDIEKNKDALLLDILNPLFGFVNEVVKNPIDTLAGVLPNVALFIGNDGIIQLVQNLITPVVALINDINPIIDVDKLLQDLTGMDNLSVTNLGAFLGDYIGADNIIPLINSLLSGIGIELPEISWLQLAALGTVSNGKSAVDCKGKRKVVDGNSEQVIVALLRYVLNTVLENGDAIKNLIGDAYKGTLKNILDMVFGLKADDLISLVFRLLDLTQSETEVYWAYKHYKAVNSKFTYPAGISAADADKAVEQLDEAVNGVFALLSGLGVVKADDLPGLVNDLLFTNEMVTKLAKTLYGALDSEKLSPYLTMAGIPVTTKGVAAILVDKSYGKTFTSASNAIKAAGSWDKVGKVNWGFTDGAANAEQGFVNALVAVLRPVLNILGPFLNGSDLELGTILYNIICGLDISSGDKKKGETLVTFKDGKLTVKSQSNGKYETVIALNFANLTTLKELKLYGSNAYESAIIPLLDVLQVDNSKIKTYKEYVKDCNKATDNVLLDILNPLMSFIDKVLEAPFDTITSVLPNLAYFIDNNGIGQLLDNVLSPVTSFLRDAKKEGVDVDEIIKAIAGKDLGKLIADLVGLKGVKLNLKVTDLKSTNIQEIVVPLINSLLKSTGIQLPEFQWSTIASHGKSVTSKSQALNAEGKYTNEEIIADKGEVLVAVLRYVADTLIKNSKSLKDLLCGIDAIKKNDMISSIIKSVFNTIGTADKDAIVRAVFYLLMGGPTNAFWDYTGYETGDYKFAYPESVDTDFLVKLSPMLDGLISGLINLNDTIGGLLFKDDLISSLVTGLYGAVEGVKVGDGTLTALLAQTGIDFSTENVAKLLTDPAYGQAFEGPAAVIKSAGSWKNVSKDALKWGVTDRDSFFHALVAALRPIYGVLDVLLNDAYLGIFNIVRIPGSNGYTSSIVPLMEAFSMYNIKTQYQYREDIKNEYDAILLDIINPLWDKIEDILNAPLQTVASMLPNLALFIGNDGLCQIIDNLLTPVSALVDAIKPVVNLNELLTAVLGALKVDLNGILGKIGITNFNLDLYDLNATLKPILGGDAIIPLVNNVLGLIKIKGQALDLKLNDVDWLQLASHGKTIVSASQAATYGSRIFVEGDPSETLIAVLRYLIDTINAGDNFDKIVGLIGGLLGDKLSDSIADVIDQVLGMLQGDTDEVIASLVDLLQTLA